MGNGPLQLSSISHRRESSPQIPGSVHDNESNSAPSMSVLIASGETKSICGTTEEKSDELENDVRSSLFGKFRTWVSCRMRFRGLPGAPLSLNLHGNAKLRQREQPVFSPEHLSFRAPVYF
jgi:hypothetical protein